MGVLYSVLPLQPDMADWLSEFGVTFPAKEGRQPLATELRSATQGLGDMSLEELGPYPDGTWQLSLESPDPESEFWTLINILDYRGETEPCTVGFEKGSPELIVRVLHRLSATVGPLVLLPDTGCPPAIVYHEKTVEEILEAWDDAGC